MIDGVNIAYREQGEGRPVVFVHGFASFSYTWLSLVMLLPFNLRYIALDMKGFGGSDKPDDELYSARDQANILVEFINRLGLDDVIIVGHSFGGIVSLFSILSKKIKNKVSGLILIDAEGYFEHMPDFIAKLRIPVANKFGLEFMSAHTLVKQVLEEVFYDHSKITEKMIAKYVEYLSLPHAKQSLIQSAYQFVSEDMRHAHEKFSQIDTPTLVISGAEDRVIPINESYHFKRDLPHVTMEVIYECGHSPQEECPEETAALITKFLSKV